MKKKKSSNFLLIFVFIIGLSLLLYPSLSNYWNSRTQSRAISSYLEMVDTLDDDAYQAIWDAAVDYNASLRNRSNPYLLSEEQQEQYQQLLNVSGTGIMGYITIPSIDVNLPLYHGTSEGVLQIATGHLEWSSLPVGGESTHCVISGHRGLPSAKLLTDLDQMQIGDTFILNVLDEMLTYEVDQIRIVDPDDTEELLVEDGKDYCTLVTCTPYGVNSHRLLVRGHRVKNAEEAVTVRVTADAIIVDQLLVAPFVLLPILLLMLVLLMITTRNKDKKPKKKKRRSEK